MEYLSGCSVQPAEKPVAANARVARQRARSGIFMGAGGKDGGCPRWRALQEDKIVAVHHLEALAAGEKGAELVAFFAGDGGDCRAREGAGPARHNGAVGAGDVDDVPGGEFTACTGDAGGEQAGAAFAQGGGGAGVDPNRPGRALEPGKPAFFGVERQAAGRSEEHTSELQ